MADKGKSENVDLDAMLEDEEFMKKMTAKILDVMRVRPDPGVVCHGYYCDMDDTKRSNESKALWEKQLDAAGVSLAEIDLDTVVEDYPLSAEEIGQVVTEIKTSEKKTKQLTETDLSQTVCKVLADNEIMRRKGRLRGGRPGATPLRAWCSPHPYICHFCGPAGQGQVTGCLPCSPDDPNIFECRPCGPNYPKDAQCSPCSPNNTQSHMECKPCGPNSANLFLDCIPCGPNKPINYYQCLICGPNNSPPDFVQCKACGPNNASAFVQCTQCGPNSIVGHMECVACGPNNSSQNFALCKACGPNNASGFVQCTQCGPNNSARGYAQCVSCGPNDSARGFVQCMPCAPNNASAFAQCTQCGPNNSARGYAQCVSCGPNNSALGFAQCMLCGPNAPSAIGCTPAGPGNDVCNNRFGMPGGGCVAAFDPVPVDTIRDIYTQLDALKRQLDAIQGK